MLLHNIYWGLLLDEKVLYFGRKQFNFIKSFTNFNATYTQLFILIITFTTKACEQNVESYFE